MSDTRDWTETTLLQQTRALRALARGLVDAQDDPADVVQDAYVAALRREPPEAPPAAWLRGAVRKLTLHRRRTDARRRRLERATAEPDQAPSTDDVVVQMELQHRIASAVLALPEAQRQAVVMRFWHDLPPREIAARLGVPVHTVKTRLQRGLARLRATLDTGRGGRAAWVAALLPWASRAPATAGVSLVLGALIMKSKLSLVAAVALLAGALGVAFLSTNAGEDAPTPSAPSTDPRIARTAEAPVDPPHTPGRSEHAARGGAPAEIVLRGTFAVTDRYGVRHDAEHGRFALVWCPPAGGVERREVQVDGGRWTATVPRNQGYSFADAVLGGRPLGHRIMTVKLPDGPLPPEFAVDFASCWLYEARVRVVDEATGADLPDVSVVRVPDDYLCHPGPSPNVLARAPSPVELPGRSADEQGKRPYIFGAPGYAWRRVDIDHAQGGEREVRLVRGGALEVVVPAGLDAPERCKLWVMALREDGRAAVSDPFDVPQYHLRHHASLELEAAGPRVVADLPPGRFLVKVSEAPFGTAYRVFAAALARVRAGQRTQVTLREPERVHPGSAAFSGTLRIASGWPVDKRLGLLFEPIDDEARQWQPEPHEVPFDRWEKASPPGTFRFATGALPLGRYHVQVVPLGAQFLLDNRKDCAPILEVPPPVDVRVRVVDGRTGTDLTKVRVSWYCGAPERLLNPEFAVAEWSAKEKAYAFRAPLGKLYFQASEDEYRFFDRTEQLHAGTNHITAKLHADDTGVEVRLMDGDTVIPWPARGWVVLEARDHDGEAVLHSRNRTSVTKAGAYLLTLKGLDLEGYRLPEPRVVTIRDGEWTKVEIPLRR